MAETMKVNTIIKGDEKKFESISASFSDFKQVT